MINRLSTFFLAVAMATDILPSVLMFYLYSFELCVQICKSNTKKSQDTQYCLTQPFNFYLDLNFCLDTHLQGGNISCKQFTIYLKSGRYTSAMKKELNYSCNGVSINRYIEFSNQQNFKPQLNIQVYLRQKNNILLNPFECIL